jgi:general nucleoside transport system permease protein
MTRRRIERRLEPSIHARIAVPLLAVAVGLIVGAAVVAAGGNNPVAAYRTMFVSAFGSVLGWEETLTQATPLILTGLAVALPVRMGLWNIGGEGQLTVGAICATGIALYVPIPEPILPLAMVVGAMVAGGAWAFAAALPRARFGINEIIVSLFLNYIALQLMSYLVNGPWGDRSAIGFAYSRAIPSSTQLPLLSPVLSIGILIAVLVAAIVAWVFELAPVGLTIRLIGSGPRLSHYLRLRVARLMIVGFSAGGAIAGLAGAIQIMGVTDRLEPGISSNYGYSGILVAFLAGSSVGGVLVGSVIYGALIVGGLALQGGGVSFNISVVVQALIILFLLVGQALARYRLAPAGVPAATPLAMATTAQGASGQGAAT